MADIQIPNDPMILLSFINTKLRDFYNSLDDFCEDTNCNKDDILSKLNSFGYEYNEQLNKFI